MPTAIIGYNASDGSEDALAFGCMLRRTLGYELIVVSCAVDALDRPGGHYAAMLRKEAEDALTSARTVIEDDRGVRFRSTRATSAGRALHDYADRHNADLIVVGATHHRATAELFTPSVTHQTIQAAPCAVAVAPAGYRDHPHPQVRRVAVAFDSSPEAFEAVRDATVVARQAGARLKVLYAYHPVAASAPIMAFSYGDPDYLAETRELAQDKVAEATTLVTDIAPDVEVSWSLLSGETVGRLVAASEHTDLMFLGSRAYGPLRRALLGSVSGSVVRRAHCPVIVAPRGAIRVEERAHSSRAHAIA